MLTLCRVLVVALFALFSVVLFTALAGPMQEALVALSAHPTFGWFAWFFVPVWAGLTVSLSVSVTAAIFLLIGLATRRFRKS